MLYSNSELIGEVSLVSQIQERLPTMKLTIRIIALTIVFAGAAAASVSSSTARPIASHQSATESNPIPTCGEGIPTCPQ